MKDKRRKVRAPSFYFVTRMKNLFVKCSIRKVLLLLFMCVSLTDAFAQFQSKYGEYEVYRRWCSKRGDEITDWSYLIVHFEDNEAIFFAFGGTNYYPAGSAIRANLKKNPNLIKEWAQGDAPSNNYFTMKYDASKSNSREECYKYYYSNPYFPDSDGWRYYYISKDHRTIRPGSREVGLEIYVKTDLSDLMIETGSPANKMKRNAPKEDGKIYE